MATRFSMPMPQGPLRRSTKYATDYKGIVAGLKIDPTTGQLSLGWQILMPPFDYDLGDAGKGPSSDGWMFCTSYNSETRHRQARGHVVAARPRLHRGRRLARGREGDRRTARATMIGGVQGDRSEEGARHRLPDAVRQVAARRRRPTDRQVDRRLRQAAGRHHASSTSRRSRPRSATRTSTGEEDGIPVLKYEVVLKDAKCRSASVRCTRSSTARASPTRRSSSTAPSPSGSSAVEHGRARRPEKVILDKIAVHYNIGHLVTARRRHRSARTATTWSASTSSRTGRHLSVGPSQPESSQLVDITEEKMKLLYDASPSPSRTTRRSSRPTRSSRSRSTRRKRTSIPPPVWDVRGCRRHAQRQQGDVKMMSSAAGSCRTSFEVQRGDEVTVAITNIEQTTDELHGFGLLDYNINLVIDPGETKTVTLHGQEDRASSRSTARTSARRSTRRCRAISSSSRSRSEEPPS